MLLTPSQVAAKLQEVSPGRSMTFSYFDFDLSDRSPLGPDGFTFPDRVLGKMMGSGYEWFYEESPIGQVCFCRLPHPYPVECGILSSVDPDRLEHFTGKPGAYRRNSFQSSYYDQSDRSIAERVYYAIEDVRRDYPWVVGVGSTIKEAVMPKFEPVEPSAFARPPIIDYSVKNWTLREYRMGGAARWYKFVDR